MGKIVVGMSGGVDSSVAAYLLQQQGYDVIGVFMKNWDDGTDNPAYRDAINGCTWEEDYADVRAVCEQLGIPYTTFNFVEEYRKAVFDEFLKELERGRTPNPDIACNQEVKFHLFMKRALALPDVNAIATGHYARITNNQLCVPEDTNKDQTYFLYRIDPAVLSQVHFPLSELTKDEVRAIAQEQGFPNADKKDSTGICFIGDIDYATFINTHLEKKPGPITTETGEAIGTHNGLHFYTLGQRRGINIGGTGPYYVAAKNQDTNTLIVVNDPDHPLLFSDDCTVEEMHWLTPKTGEFDCDVQIRYRQERQRATISVGEQTTHIRFHTPQRAVTPGQSAVLYQDGVVLGGGIIQ